MDLYQFEKFLEEAPSVVPTAPEIETAPDPIAQEA
jgi:hypothetical protein